MARCESCGIEFQPKKTSQRFCSLSCANMATARRRNLTGANNPNYGKPRSPETREKIAAAARGRVPSAATRAKLSADRKGKPKSEQWRAAIAEGLRNSTRLDNSGEKNPNFKTGKYIKERAYRELVALESCAECGATGVVFDVHHIDGDHNNNDLSNLIVLCRKCHGEKHGRPVGVKESRPRARAKRIVLR